MPVATIAIDCGEMLGLSALAELEGRHGRGGTGGAALDGAALDGAALDGAALDGAALDGAADERQPASADVAAALLPCSR